MTRHTSSRPCDWVQPRARSGNSREWVHGPLHVDEAKPFLHRVSKWLTRIAFCSFLALAGYHVAFGLWHFAAF